MRREIARHAEFTGPSADRRGEREIGEARSVAGPQAPGPGGERGALFAALAEARSAERARLAAEAARALGCEGGLGAAETALRARLLKLGGGMLGQPLSPTPASAARGRPAAGRRSGIHRLQG